MNRPAKIRNIIPLQNGLFSHINYQFWDFTSDELDIMLLSKIGQRLPAPILDIIQGPPEDPFDRRPYMTSSELDQLGQIILRTYKNKWDRLSDLHSEDYDILKNYLDEYQEVLQDDDSSSISKSANRADRSFETSQLASKTGGTITQQSENSNTTESTRNDNFSSDFTRSSTDATIRTDDLIEGKVEKEDVESTRTDNLTDNGTRQSTDSQSHNGGGYTETISRHLETDNSNNGSSGVYGFNSSQPVGDTTNEGTSDSEENESTSKVVTGTKFDSITKSGTDQVSHTGTQGTITDANKSYEKSNTGTQNTEETVAITDSTTNVDEQTNTTVSDGSSTSSNETMQNATSSTDTSTGLTSQLAEDSTVSRALSRARQYIHKGNNGNITPQQLIRQEIDLWRWNFIEEVLNDIKSFITIPVYAS